MASNMREGNRGIPGAFKLGEIPGKGSQNSRRPEWLEGTEDRGEKEKSGPKHSGSAIL